MTSRKHKTSPDLTQKILREWLVYSPDTGHFTWLKGGRWDRNRGKRAGTTNRDWYVKIQLLGVYHHAHRLAWLYMTGSWPEAEIDHINRIKSDNRWCNLRPATPKQNLANKGAQSNSGTGVRGVHFYKSRSKWVPYIQGPDGKLKHLGYYDTLEEATRVRVAAARAAYGEYADEG